MKHIISSVVIGLALVAPAQAAAKSCKISVVGGSWAGKTYPLTIKNGKFTGASGVRASPLKGCPAMKYVYGRWYHLCKGGKIAVFRKSDGKWQRLKPKNERKYKHDCL